MRRTTCNCMYTEAKSECNYTLVYIVGGVLVFANNSLIYLNQSVPPYGVSLNSMTEGSTMFPLSKSHHSLIFLCSLF